MDNNNWRPAQPEPAMDGNDWRTQLQADSRQRIVNKIMDTLKRHLPISGPEGLLELRKIAVRFEEKIYTAATSQSDYLRKISLKMLTMETKSQNTGGVTSMPPNSAGGTPNAPDPASHSVQSQARNQGQTPIPLPNQSQARQQLLSQHMPNTIGSAGVQGSSSLSSGLSSMTGVTPSSMQNGVGQSASVQNISGMPQNSVGNSVGNIFANSQRQLQGRQHQQQVVSQQSQQQSQNPQQYMYQQQQQQQLQNQILKQKLQQGNIPPSLMQSHIQQQNLLQSTQLQTSQQSLMQGSSGLQTSQSTVQQTQPPLMQSASHSSLQQNQQPSIQQPTNSVQSILRQQQSQQSMHPQNLHQQQTSIPPQQLQQSLAGQTNPSTLQQNQLHVQQNSVSDIQQQQQQQHHQQQQQQHHQQHHQQQQQQRLLSQQNNMSNMQQQQQQQHLLAQQNNMSNLQQQQMFGPQSGMQQHQQPMHILQQQKSAVQQQQTGQASSALLQIPGQQSQSQPLQQQVMPQLQQPTQLQHQTNPLQRDMQQRLQSGLQPQNVIQSQRPLPEVSSTSIDSTAQTGNTNAADWQEEVYQKIKSMKDMYFPELGDMYQKICHKLQLESNPQHPKEQLEKVKMMKMMLERIMSFLQVTKNVITQSHREKLNSYEKNIVSFLQSNRPKKLPAPQGQQQIQPSHPLSMQQQYPQTQVSHQADNQMNSLVPGMNLQNANPMQPTSATSMSQANIMSSLPPHLGPTSQPNIMGSLPGSTLESGQGMSSSSLQQGGVSLQQTTVPANQQNNISTSQSGVNGLQPNTNSAQLNPSMLQHQHLKQQQELQVKQQLQQRQMHQQILQQQQKQQILQQQQHPQLQQQPFQQQLQQQKQQSAQLQSHQMPQLHQMSEDMKIRPGMGFKPGMIQPQTHHIGQRSTFNNQQMKPGSQFPISPQLPASSPQMSQHSPQIDQQNLLTPFLKPTLPSANSPFIVPSPSTPLAPSPLPGEPEKQVPGVSSLSNTGPLTQAPSIATPGLSASPLLEFTSPDGNQGAVSNFGKASVTEQPLERLIKAVKTMSPKALTASVSDIGSVISMIDRIAGSAPGNGSRAAVGEDLVALTKCRLQARNTTQDGSSATKKMRRDTSAMPLNAMSSAGSVNDSFKHLNGLEISDLESTATSRIKRPRVEANHALLEEIREINQRLIDTVVEISDEDVDPTAAAAAAEGGEGAIVKCSFNAVSLSPNLKTQYVSAQMSPIEPLRLLVPTNYPNCSPMLLDKCPVELSREYEDLSAKARSMFNISLRSLSQPMSLGEMVKTWDVCARAVVADLAQQSGGGTFSSRYGTWENCVSAA